MYGKKVSPSIGYCIWSKLTRLYSIKVIDFFSLEYFLEECHCPSKIGNFKGKCSNKSPIFQTKRGKMTGKSIFKDQFLLEIICLPIRVLTLFKQKCLFGNQLLSLSYSWQYVNLIRWPAFHHMRASWYSVPNCFLVPFIPDSIVACQLGPFFAGHPCINWLLLVLQNLRLLLTFRLRKIMVCLFNSRKHNMQMKHWISIQKAKPSACSMNLQWIEFV